MLMDRRGTGRHCQKACTLEIKACGYTRRVCRDFLVIL
jgi:hypothetical protein